MLTNHTVNANELAKKVTKIPYREKTAMRIVARGTTTSKTKSVYDFIPTAALGYARSLLQKMLTTFKTSKLFEEINEMPIFFELSNISTIQIYTDKERIWYCNHFFPVVVSKSDINEVFLSELLKSLDDLIGCQHEVKKNQQHEARNQWRFKLVE